MPRLVRELPRSWRTGVGLAAAVVLPMLSALALVPLRGRLNLVSDALLFLLGTVIVAFIGGLVPALVSAVASLALLNYYFTPPLHTWFIEDANNALALAVFVSVAVLVSSAVDLALRRSDQAARAAAESRTLAQLATGALGSDHAVSDMLERLREHIGLDAVVLEELAEGGWVVVAGSGDTPYGGPGPDAVMPATDAERLLLFGPEVRPRDRRLVRAFAAQVAASRERIRLHEQAKSNEALAEVNKMRTALLAAVGHDLRTPLAGAKAAVSGLLSGDVTLTDEDRRELLTGADSSLDKLAGLIANLLDMSRLQAGAMSVQLVPVEIEDVVAATLGELGPDGHRVLVDLPPGLPAVAADPGLLDRVLANVLANAVRYSPKGRPPTCTACDGDGRVRLSIVDHGPGIPEPRRGQVFQPFQRLGDTDNTTGLGLGLALSRGLTEAMGGRLDLETTPGGGVTMVLTLPVHRGEGDA